MSLKDGRCVARPLQNLGSTCFVNCVLQALAHAPELCMAVDAQPHSSVCPIAAENAAAFSTLGVSNNSKGSGKRAGAPSSNSSASSGASDDDPAVGSRRSSRGKAKAGAAVPGGRKSPSSDQDSNRSSNSRQRKYCVLCELESHFKAVHDANRRDKALAPSTFVNGFFEHVAPWFKLGVQEDAHEFLRLLIDAMQKSCQQARLQDNPQDDAAVGATTASTAEEASGGDAAPPVPSISISSGTVSKDDKEYPFSLFRGMVESKVVCAACQASSSTLDPIEDVGLEVSVDYPSGNPSDTAQAASASTRASRNASPLLPHGNASLADVQSAFQRFARVEQVDGYKCEKCGCTGRATKQSRLASIPPILTLHLKRFRYGDSRLIASGSASGATSASYGAAYTGAAGYGVSTVTTRSSRSGGRSEASQLNTQDFVLGGKSGSAKIEGHVKFDLFFDLKPYLTPEMQTSVNSMFCRLFAVIVHAGKNSHSGHYIAYVQSLNKNEWWKMDDGRVTLVDKSDVLQAEAYMLFYRVIQHPVAVTLSNAYDTLLAARRAAEESPHGSAARAVGRSGVVDDASTSNGRGGGKRSRSTYRDGEAWARAKAPRLLGVATKAQEVVAEALDLTSDFLQRIQDEASRDGAPEDYDSETLMITDEDVVGGVSKVRQRLADLFYRLAQHFDDGPRSDTPRPRFLDPMDSNGGSDNGDRSNKAGSTSTSTSTSKSSTASGKANPKALTTKAAVGPSDKKSSVVVVDLVDDDATDLL